MHEGRNQTSVLISVVLYEIFILFIGRRFQCAFCKATTEVPAEYFQHLDHTGKRVDHYQRAELCLGTYETAATKDYCREGVEPQTPAILFAIDVSYPMMKEGIVQMICSNMKEMLKNLPRDMYCDKVSFSRKCRSLFFSISFS